MIEYEMLTEANIGETIGDDWEIGVELVWPETGPTTTWHRTQLGGLKFTDGHAKLKYRRPQKAEPGVAIEKLHVSDAFTINQIARIVHDNAVAHGWWNEERNDGELIALIHSEASEALEALRKPGPSEHCPELLAIEEELADIVIRVMDFSSARGWDLGEAIRQKHAYNITRPHKHGGKRF